MCLFAFDRYSYILFINPIFCHLCVKHLDVTITVSWSSCGLCIFDPFEALPNSQSIEFPRMPSELCFMHGLKAVGPTDRAKWCFMASWGAMENFQHAQLHPKIASVYIHSIQWSFTRNSIQPLIWYGLFHRIVLRTVLVHHVELTNSISLTFATKFYDSCPSDRFPIIRPNGRTYLPCLWIWIASVCDAKWPVLAPFGNPNREFTI